MTSDQILDAGADLCMYPIERAIQAKTLPRMVRFAMMIAAIPACFVTIAISIPLLFIGVALNMWEESA